MPHCLTTVQKSLIIEKYIRTERMKSSMSDINVEELIRTMSAQRVEALRADLAADLQAAWEKGRAAGKAEGISEGEFRGRKQGVISVAVNLLRAGTDTATVAKAAELPEPLIRKIAQDNGITLA